MDAQAAGPVVIETSLDTDVTFGSMAGTEGLSQLFAYDIEVLCSRSDLGSKEWFGASVTVRLTRVDETEEARQWSGIVTHCEYLGSGDDQRSRYRITIRPWLWYLTQRTDCRIFQNLRVPEIITQVFRDRGFADFALDLTEQYATREYVVQYRETDFNFVSRWMEREGIYYFFRHADGKHTLVLSDSSATPRPARDPATLPYAPPDAQREDTIEYVTEWRAQGTVRPMRVALVDYDFTRPRLDLYTTTQVNQDNTPALEIYDYPGGYVDPLAGNTYAQLSLEQQREGLALYVAQTNARALAVGTTFSLADHPREDQNASYLVVSAHYRVTGHDIHSDAQSSDVPPFACELRAMPAKVRFRAPARARKAIVRGPQTAQVVGPAGREIWTDRYGRVKVQFHWDRIGKFDENSSCFVRVSQIWAGTGWGAQFIPRIGQEVVVDFLEGDPDQPLIVGSVYNGTHDPPFKLPDHQTQSGLRSRSTPQGTQVNGNEIRFEDSIGNEDLYIQAENAQTTLVKGNQSITVGKHRGLRVDGSEAISVGTTRSVQVLGASTISVGANRIETVGGVAQLDIGAEHLTNVAGASTLNVGKDCLTQVGGITRFDLAGPLRVTAAGAESRTIGGTRDVRVGAKATHTYAAETRTVVGHPDREASQTTYVYGPSTTITSKDLTIQSDTSIVLQCADTKIEITPDGIKLNGKTISVAAPTSFTVTTANGSLVVDDNVTAVGQRATISSSGAQLALASDAKLVGSQVQLGAGAGANASSSAKDGKDDKDKKPVFLRTRILRNGSPAAGVAYTLVLDGGTELSGSTTGDGLVVQQVPATVASAMLTLHDTGETMALTIGVVEPETTIAGAQFRLQRLGFYHGALDGRVGPLTAHALAMFQKINGLNVTGDLDGATQAALKSAYGS